VLQPLVQEVCHDVKLVPMQSKLGLVALAPYRQDTCDRETRLAMCCRKMELGSMTRSTPFLPSCHAVGSPGCYGLTTASAWMQTGEPILMVSMLMMCGWCWMTHRQQCGGVGTVDRRVTSAGPPERQGVTLVTQDGGVPVHQWPDVGCPAVTCNYATRAAGRAHWPGTARPVPIASLCTAH
jgi:hypothetical protein